MLHEFFPEELAQWLLKEMEQNRNRSIESQKVLPAAFPWCLPIFSCDACAARVLSQRPENTLLTILSCCHSATFTCGAVDSQRVDLRHELCILRHCRSEFGTQVYPYKCPGAAKKGTVVDGHDLRGPISMLEALQLES